MKASSMQCKPPVAWLAGTMLACSIVLAACGSSDNGSATLDDDPVPSTPAEPSLTFYSVKTFRFSWSDVSDASYYKLLENPDGVSGFTQVGSDVLQGIERIDHIVPLYARSNAQYILQSCGVSGCVDSDVLTVTGTFEDAIGYLKAINTGSGDGFGTSVSLSADGKTLAIGAPWEVSNATGVNGDESDNSAEVSGAVYVFTRSGSDWSQHAHLKSSNSDVVCDQFDYCYGDYFGNSISLSADGTMLAVGAWGEDSNATGIDGDQDDYSSQAAGAVYVFTKNNGDWLEQAYIKASNTDWGDNFGRSVSLNADGSTLAVGAIGEDSGATGIDGDQSDNSAQYWSGAVYVFSRNGNVWSQQAYIKASNSEPDDYFGTDVSLSADGTTLAVGATGEASHATGINGDESDNSNGWSGAVYMFTQSGSSWNQQAYIKASNTETSDYFGSNVSLSADGNTLAIAAPLESSSATSVNGDQNNNSAWGSGAVYVFTRSSGSWSQQAYVKANDSDLGFDGYASASWGDLSVSLSENGNTLAVGAFHVFSLSGGSWSQQAYLEASNSSADDYFGGSVSLSGDGSTLAVGAPGEDSNATGVNGDQSDNSAEDSGALYLY